MQNMCKNMAKCGPTWRQPL